MQEKEEACINKIYSSPFLQLILLLLIRTEYLSQWIILCFFVVRFAVALKAGYKHTTSKYELASVGGCMSEVYDKFMAYFKRAVYLVLSSDSDSIVDKITYGDLDQYNALSNYIWSYLKQRI